MDAVHHQPSLGFLHELISSGECGGKILEIGCGPVLAWQISAAPHASEIVFAELVESNRDAIHLWLDKDPRAHDWTPFFRHVVQTLEGKGEEEIAKREEQLRRTVKAVIPCDATEDPPVPLGFEGPYDVVMESAMSTIVSKNEDDFLAFWARLATILKPGGTLISRCYLVENHPALNHTYLVGGAKFVALNVSEEILRSCLEKVGFSNIKLEKSPMIEPATASHIWEDMQQGVVYRCVFLTANKSD